MNCSVMGGMSGKKDVQCDRGDPCEHLCKNCNNDIPYCPICGARNPHFEEESFRDEWDRTYGTALEECLNSAKHDGADLAHASVASNLILFAGFVEIPRENAYCHVCSQSIPVPDADE